MGRVLGNAVFWTWHDSCIHELTLAVAVYTRPVEIQPYQHSILERARTYKATPLSEEQEAVSGY